MHILRDIKNREAVGFSKLGSIHKLELEKALRSSIKTASDIANEYKDLQGKHKLEAEIGRKDSEITSLGAKVNELEKKERGLICRYGLISYFRSRVKELKDQLEQQIFLSFHKPNIIGEAEADLDSAKNSLEKESFSQETNTHLAKQISEASSKFNEVIEGDSKPEK
ncbi:9650_t:CDS:2, partial [Dentiscutata heterogama]